LACGRHESTQVSIETIWCHAIGASSSIVPCFDTALSDRAAPEGWKCSVCSVASCNTRGVQSTCIQRAPEVLIVSLKRFDNAGNKISSPVEISSSIVVPTAKGPKTYHQVSSISHIGASMSRGHYTASSRHGLPSKPHSTFLVHDDSISPTCYSGLSCKDATEAYVVCYVEEQCNYKRILSSDVPITS
jgi:ubiquitin C-terminal hydrolase